MGLFGNIGRGFDRAANQAEQQRQMEEKMRAAQGGPPMMTMTPPAAGNAMGQQQEQAPGIGKLFGGVGGANLMHQTQQVEKPGEMGFLSNMSAFGPLMTTGSSATPQQQKDFRVLE